MKTLKKAIVVYEENPSEAFDYLRDKLGSFIIDHAIPEFIVEEMEKDFQDKVAMKQKQADTWKKGVLKKKTRMLKLAEGDRDLTERYNLLFARIIHHLDFHGKGIPGQTIAHLKVAVYDLDPFDFLPIDLAELVDPKGRGTEWR